MAGQPLLTLTAAVERKGDLLRVAYAVANPSAVLAYLSVRTTPCGLASRRPYAVLRTDHLLLTFQTTPFPPNHEAIAATLPLFAAVPPGRTHEDFGEVSVPVQEQHAYSSADGPADCPTVLVDRIRFALEYVADGDKHFLSPDRRQAGLYYTRGDPMPVLECDLVLPTAVPVLKRPADFFRW